MIILLAGAAVIYKTRYQKAIALSSTEAEFVAASETGKMIRYPRSLLHDLGHGLPDPTVLNIDSTGTTFMIGAQAPTKRTRHIDIRYFAILDWTASNQLVPRSIKMDENISNSMTKPLVKIKFHQQVDLCIMGRTPPVYVPSHNRTTFLEQRPPSLIYSLHATSSPLDIGLRNARRCQFALTYPFFAQIPVMQDHGGGGVSWYST